MGLRLAIMASLLAGLAPAIAGAGEVSVSEQPDSVSITAYREWGGGWGRRYGQRDLGPADGLVLVTEVRTIDVPAGRATISFRGVAEGIIPQTAAVEGLPAEMVERNHDFDLLSPGALIGKSIGRRVRLVRTNPVNGEVIEEAAVVRSGPQGVVLDYGDGRVEAVNCSGWPERLIFDDLPHGLADRPTLSVVTEAEAAGRYQVRLSYLAFGVKWAADYVARIHPERDRLDLTGWITLSNRSGTGFAAAPTQVVAGNVERERATLAPEGVVMGRSASCWQMDTTTKIVPEALLPPLAAGGMVEALVVTAQKREEDIQNVPIAISAFEGELADYKLYTLPEPTTVAALQTKQVMLLHQTDVPFERLYVHELRAYDQPRKAEPASVILRLVNTKAGGLGRAIPAGHVAVMAPYREGALLAGEDDLGDIPVGRPFELELGRTIDVRAEERMVRWWNVDLSDDEYVTRREFEVALANDKAVAAIAELRLDAEHRVVSASRRYQRHDGDIVWKVRLKPGERRILRFVTESE